MTSFDALPANLIDRLAQLLDEKDTIALSQVCKNTKEGCKKRLLEHMDIKNAEKKSKDA